MDRGDTLPLGIPQLMMALTRDGQLDGSLQQSKEWNCTIVSRVWIFYGLIWFDLIFRGWEALWGLVWRGEEEKGVHVGACPWCPSDGKRWWGRLKDRTPRDDDTFGSFNSKSLCLMRGDILWWLWKLDVYICVCVYFSLSMCVIILFMWSTWL